MKVFMLSNPAAIHTQRWVSALAKRGVEIMLYSFYPCEKVDYYRGIKHVQVKSFWQSRDSKGIKGFILVKLFVYYRALIKDIRNSIQIFHPDIVHAHYLSDNGLFGALAGFHPFVVSAWGTDVYDYPRRSWSRACVIKYILKKADRVLSTSHVMAGELARYTDKKQIPVTPFGVDMTLFKRFPKKHQETDGFVFGIVKTLEYGYGIDTLIDAFALLCKRRPDLNLCLRIVGEGSEREKLQLQAINWGLAEKIIFEGKVVHDHLPEVISSFDVFVALSRAESFGVAVVEAMAVGCPVVVSDAPGFTEIVKSGESGLIVERENPQQASEAMETLVNDETLRVTLAQNGEKRVRELYDWDKNVEDMIEIYQEIMEERNV